MKAYLIVIVGLLSGCSTVDRIGTSFFRGAIEAQHEQAAYYQTPEGQMYRLREQLRHEHRETIRAIEDIGRR